MNAKNRDGLSRQVNRCRDKIANLRQMARGYEALGSPGIADTIWQDVSAQLRRLKLLESKLFHASGGTPQTFEDSGF